MRTTQQFIAMLVTAVFLSSVSFLQAETKLDDLIAPGTQAKVLGTGYGFCEGPAVDAEGNVYFSDGKKDAIHYYPAAKDGGPLDAGPVTKFADSYDANGMMFNSRGELVVCEGAGFHVVAFDTKTKEKREIVCKIDGTRFNEPNDLTIDQTDGFYFTDPNYKHRGQETVMKEDVYYVTNDGKPTRVSTVCTKPNGILLTPDHKTLYLADNRERKMYRYDVTAPGKLENETLWVADLGAGPDGMTLDTNGNLYVACGGAGVRVFSPEGELIGVIGKEYGVPHASNVVFGGRELSTLFMTSRDQFLGLEMKSKGNKALCAE